MCGDAKLLIVVILRRRANLLIKATRPVFEVGIRPKLLQAGSKLAGNKERVCSHEVLSVGAITSEQG